MNNTHTPAIARPWRTSAKPLLAGALLTSALLVAPAQASASTAAALEGTSSTLGSAGTLTLHGPPAAALADLTAQAVLPLEELEAEPRTPTLPTAAPDPGTPASAAPGPGRDAPPPSAAAGAGLRLDLDLDLDTPIEPRTDIPTQPVEAAPEISAPAPPVPTASPAPPVAASPPASPGTAGAQTEPATGTPPAVSAPASSAAPPSASPPVDSTPPPVDAASSAAPRVEAPAAPAAQPDPPRAPDTGGVSGSVQPGIVRIQPPPRSGLPVWVYLLGAALLLAALVAAVVVVLRRRAGTPGPTAATRASAPRTPAPAAAGPAAAAARAPVTPPAPAAAPLRQAAAGSRPLAILRDLSGTTDQAEHPIGAAVVQIGRAESELAGVQSVVVQKKTVGRRHAVIEFRNHTYWLVDQGSLNGTYVNGDRVAGEVALRPGARISLESAEFEFVMPGMDMNATMVASSVDEFSETLVAPSIAGAPGRQTRGAADRGVDARDDTARPAERDAIAAAAATGMVDFDVLGDADAAPPGKDRGKRG